MTTRTSWRGPMILGLIAVLVMVAGVGGWMMQARIAGAVIAPGTVAVRGKPQTVQHLDGGIVQEIRVQNGQAVEKGQILLLLDDTTIRANLAIYLNRLREALAREARLAAELREDEIITAEDLREQPVDVGSLDLVLETQTGLLRARRELRLGQMELLTEKANQFENQINGVAALIEAKREQLALVERELDDANQLLTQRLVQQSRVTALERQRADLRGQVAEHEAEIARLRNAIGETRIQALQIGREHQETVLNEKRQIATEIDELIQQIQATVAQLDRVAIRSPSDGLVHEMSVFTVGGVVAAGAPILQVIPISRGVELEATVPTADIDQIYLGQVARLRFPAFNQRTTPEIEGAVAMISPSSIVDEKTGNAFFRVGLTVPQDQLQRLGDLTLTPGMPAEAFLVTERRTVIGYLLRPLTDYFNRAWRER